MFLRQKYLFPLILTYFLIFGIFRITDPSRGFYQNEASFGYNAYSLLLTGKDEYGKSFPLILESFGDYKLAGFSYFLVPGVAILGLTEFAVRFSVLFESLLSLILVYLIVKFLSKNTKLANL